jgi:hypothetical protein
VTAASRRLLRNRRPRPGLPFTPSRTIFGLQAKKDRLGPESEATARFFFFFFWPSSSYIFPGLRGTLLFFHTLKAPPLLIKRHPTAQPLHSPSKGEAPPRSSAPLHLCILLHFCSGSVGAGAGWRTHQKKRLHTYPPNTVQPAQV